MSPDFSERTKRSAAEMAGFICSNPSCLRLCIGPTGEATFGRAYVGEIAHISDARNKTIRWETNRDDKYRSSIENALFLCPTCHTLIDKNSGRDYPISILKNWKVAHHELIREALTGGFKLAHNLRSQTAKAAQILTVIDQCAGMRAMTEDPRIEDPAWTAESFVNLKTMAVRTKGHFTNDRQTRRHLDAIVSACNAVASSLSGSLLGSSVLDQKQSSVLLLARCQIATSIKTLSELMDLEYPSALTGIDENPPRRYF